ncbi:hypothetical protein HON22_05295 [Candidatus Peregrinibacteria bacterium]|nr:hypothetical protein [Candidatus Peregrinibacteria bacterium]
MNDPQNQDPNAATGGQNTGMPPPPPGQGTQGMGNPSGGAMNPPVPGQQMPYQQHPGAGMPPPPPGQGVQAPPPPVVPIGSFGRDDAFSTTIVLPKHNLQFDEQYFLKLLAGSISLSKDEKKRIIESIPKLSQYQIDELIKIFEEEKRKFSELDTKHKEQLGALETKHSSEWEALEMEYQQNSQQGEEDTAAADIRKSLGLASDE